MTFRSAITLLLSLVLSVACLAQNHRQPLPNVPAAQDGDWAVSLGNSAGMAQGVLPTTFLSAWPTPSCTNDFLFVPINATPAVGGQANLLILNQLYRGPGPGLCGTGAAAVKAGYAVGTTPLVTMATYSVNGAKVAILESATAKLHIITVGSTGSVTNAAAPTETVLDFTNVTVTNCPAGSVHTSNASEFEMDYATDEGYVGDDNGRLYHLTGIFNGTPAVDFCTSIVAAGTPVGFPQLETVSGVKWIYVVTNKKRILRTRVNIGGTAFSGISSTLLSSANGITERWQPLVVYPASGNPALHQAYVWTNNNAAGTQASLYQLDMSTAPPSILAELQISPAVTTQRYFMGWFNRIFFENSPNDPNALGYTCVYPSGATGAPALASYNFNSVTGVINGFTAMTGNTNINPATGATAGNVCQGITETVDTFTATDTLFVSTGNGSTANGSKFSRFDTTSPTVLTNSSTPTHSITGTTNDPGGTSFIQSDWQSSNLGAQTLGLYFGTVARPTTAKCGGSAPNFNFCVIHVKQADLL